MFEEMTEDAVRDSARDILGLTDSDVAKAGVGQITTFNQLGFKGVQKKPDGWYLPYNTVNVALILETKATCETLGENQVNVLLEKIKIVQRKYKKVVGLLYNGVRTRVFKGYEEVEAPEELQTVTYYTSLYSDERIDKERIYQLTARINNCLHAEFGIKNLYHRMVFTACALVAKRYGAFMAEGMGYSEFHNAILSCLNKELINHEDQNRKLKILSEVFSEIKMNLDVNSEEEKEQERIKILIAEFIDWVTKISDNLNSAEWRGEDVMGIFFNEFNRYKGKSEVGQVFTPEHITDFMFRILSVGAKDNVLDAACGSGGFLVKAMANMIKQAGGPKSKNVEAIKDEQLFGIEFDREIYALACANMLIHLDGKTNLEQLDARYANASEWISHAGKEEKKDKEGKSFWEGKGITKVLMNPPFEDKHGCLDIVENVLDSVPDHTDCAFILPEKKLEKGNRKRQVERILKRHKLTKVIKLPENLFLTEGVTTSIFVFESGVSQNGERFFACHMESDGFETVKNKGRHDTQGKWAEIENRWVEIVKRQSGDKTCQWNDPNACLSYQTPQKPFEVYEEDFMRAQVDYLLFKAQINPESLAVKIAKTALYSSDASLEGNTATVRFEVGEPNA